MHINSPHIFQVSDSVVSSSSLANDNIPTDYSKTATAPIPPASNSSSSSSSAPSTPSDPLTCKPKPIKVALLPPPVSHQPSGHPVGGNAPHGEQPSGAGMLHHSYHHHQTPLSYSYGSPKNPIGVSPFQPTGKLFHSITFQRNPFCRKSFPRIPFPIPRMYGSQECIIPQQTMCLYN